MIHITLDIQCFEKKILWTLYFVENIIKSNCVKRIYCIHSKLYIGKQKQKQVFVLKILNVIQL